MSAIHLNQNSFFSNNSYTDFSHSVFSEPMFVLSENLLKNFSYNQITDACNQIIRNNPNLSLKLPVLRSLVSVLTDNVSIIERSFSEAMNQIEWEDTANKFLSIYGLEAVIVENAKSLIKACEMFSFFLDHLNAFSHYLDLSNNHKVFFAKPPSISQYYKPTEDSLEKPFDFNDYFLASLSFEIPSKNKCLKYLFKKYSTLYSDKWMSEVTDIKETWLHLIATTGRYDIFQIFIPYYLEKYQIKSNKLTEVLLKNLVTNEGHTVLHKAAALSLDYGNQNSESQALFIKKLMGDFPAFDINQSDVNGKTPLNLFIEGGIDSSAEMKTESLDILFDLGADPNIDSNNRQTPLHHVVKQNYYYDENGRIAKYLIAKGANPYKKDSLGRSPISIINSNLQFAHSQEEINHWEDLLSFIKQQLNKH